MGQDGARFHAAGTLSGMRLFCGLALLCALQPLSLCAQSVDLGHLTVDAINRNPTGSAPSNPSWTPDGKTLTYVVGTGQGVGGVGESGDILAIDAATGKARVLASAAQLSSLGSGAVKEKDRDHRERYGMAGYFWEPDGKHLLLDLGGVLWLYDLAAGKGTEIVDTKSGSGDDPKFSPDAKYVSYLREHNLYVHPVGGGQRDRADGDEG